ncbi:MAG: MerR family transcriptional regulator [Bacteroidales bacterium]|jgi:DNA-binding transcriptional MerR regulator|nr:MerR family transcriptional regulator [Bacteroidales bacterium]
MEKIYYTIGETAEILGESTSLVRFWTNSFEKFLNPRRNAKGNRIYTADEIDTLKQIHLLVKEQGMTLEGAARRLAEDRRSVDSRVKALDTLKEIRAQLAEIRSSL